MARNHHTESKVDSSLYINKENGDAEKQEE